MGLSLRVLPVKENAAAAFHCDRVIMPSTCFQLRVKENAAAAFHCDKSRQRKPLISHEGEGERRRGVPLRRKLLKTELTVLR